MGLGVIRGMRGMKGLSGLKPVERLDTLEERETAEDERLKGWIERVGEARAQQAWALRPMRARATLPELLAEVWLRARSVRYVAQFDLGWARPDLALFDVLGVAGVMIWEIQGEYWHGSAGAQAKDAGRKERLLRSTVRELPVMAVIECWESDIYAGDVVFDRAYAGHGLRV